MKTETIKDCGARDKEWVKLNGFGKEFSLPANGVVALERRYLKKDDEGKVVETVPELFMRVAENVAKPILKREGEEAYKKAVERYFDLMTNLDFLPNSPTLANSGHKKLSLSGCFVLPVEDSMEGIFDAVKYAAIVHKSGGGTGFSFSRLRPRGDIVGSTKGVSSGPLTFMTVFDTATEAVKQGGVRRGANMGMLRVDHPDILEFIECKDDGKKLTNFNISVAVTEAFWKALEDDGEYEIQNPKSKKTVAKLKAKEVFSKIVHQAWKNGEPGVVFIDLMNADNPTPEVGDIESTNPCGEQPLLPYESCNLGSINLANMVKEKKYDGVSVGYEVDWEKLKACARDAVWFLNGVIDINHYPLKEIDKLTKENRKIGLGVMGWADMLVRLGLPYDSHEARSLAEEVMRTVRDSGCEASGAMAAQFGNFPNWERSVWGKGEPPVPMYNATVTTIAPTGTLSVIAGCASGIEPIFALAYIKTCMDKTQLPETNPYFREYAEKEGVFSDELAGLLAKPGNGTLKAVPEKMVPAASSLRKVFVTAHDIKPEDHVLMQASFQKYTHNACSKTVNLPHDATEKDVEEIYLLAHKTGCKGVTVYRDGSREEQVLTTGMGVVSVVKVADEFAKVKKRPRPDVRIGGTFAVTTGCGTMYLTINQDDKGGPFEVFTNMGKAGGCASSQSEAIGRLVSLALRSNVDPQEIVSQLKGISCHQPVMVPGGKTLSCSDGLAKIIEKFMTDNPVANCSANGGNGKNPEKFYQGTGACPECGSQIEPDGGCATCKACGFTKC